VSLFAQPSFGSNAVTATEQQHPHEQFRNNRGPAARAVEWFPLAPNTRKVDEPVDRPQKVRGRHMALKREFAEQSRLISLLGTHIDLASTDTKSAIASRFNKGVYQQNRREADKGARC
jgi:hypothetical protein